MTDGVKMDNSDSVVCSISGPDRTSLTTAGRNHGALDYPSVSVPVYRASTLVFGTLEEFEKAERGQHQHHCYGRHGSPTTRALADAICELEGADDTVLTSSGLTAIVVALMAFSDCGSHILVCDSVYGPTREFCDNELKRYGVETTYFPPDIGSEIGEMIRENTSLIFMESPGSLTFEMQDIGAVADAAHNNRFGTDITVIADSTWATPMYFKPFEHGIDVSIQAVTKYIGGHSDLLMGSVSAREKHLPAIRRMNKSIGSRVSGDECFLALRGLRSMAVRLEYHQKSTLRIAEWLSRHDMVKEVYYPALASDKGHERWRKYMSGATGLFAVNLGNDVKRDALAAMLDGLEYFGMGFSWGGFESLIIPYKPYNIRTASRDKWDKDTTLLRLNIGLEDTDMLIADLEAGFERMRKAE